MTTLSELEQLYRTHHRALASLARRLCGSQADADDLVQATFERSIRRFSSFRQGSNGERWLATIMSRLFIDGWRRERRAPMALCPMHLDALVPPPDEAPWWRALTEEDLRVALAELPSDLRQLLEGFLFDRLSYARLAARLGIIKSTVGTRLYRSRKLLRAALLRPRAGSHSADGTPSSRSHGARS
jgi:RNA polymerase sigma-70 factor (ECF subfamily)